MIRNISRFDDSKIYEMLCHFRDCSQVKIVEKFNNAQHIEMILNHIRAGGGVGLVACKDLVPVGVLLSLMTPMVWEPNTYTLNELVFWMEPEARKSRLGYLLLKEYVRIGQGMKKSGQIQAFTMTRRAGTQVNYSRFGFVPVDENWSQ